MARAEAIDVVVAGAGPTGLTVALQLRQMGASVRIVEKLPQPRPHTPALAIHPRTLELLRGLAVADRLVVRGASRVDLRLHFGEHEVLGQLDELGFADTQYPFILFVPQPLVEEEIRLRLADLGTEVEFGKALESVTEEEDGVVSSVVTPDGAEAIASRYLVGCDGPDSAVRHEMGIRFIGRSYRQTVLVGDVAPIEARIGTATDAFFGDLGILFLFPLPTGSSRLIAVQPAGVEADDPIRVIDRHVSGLLGMDELVWHERVRPQRRVARHFRAGRVFLAGDAAHVHSPAGAQGMNSGIQDAVNLGWKLALACRGAPAPLDSYEKERRPVAIRNILLTEAAFMVEASATWPFRFARTVAGPPVAKLVTRRPALMQRVARLVSGLDIRYRVEGPRRPPRPGLPPPGSRLPDAIVSGTAGAWLHHYLNGSTFHVFSFGPVPDPSVLAAVMDRHGDLVQHHHLSSCPWTPDAIPLTCLVRPDGHIAAWSGPELEEVMAALERLTRKDHDRSDSYPTSHL